jgi:hypothetical protein
MLWIDRFLDNLAPLFQLFRFHSVEWDRKAMMDDATRCNPLLSLPFLFSVFVSPLILPRRAIMQNFQCRWWCIVWQLYLLHSPTVWFRSKTLSLAMLVPLWRALSPCVGLKLQLQCSDCLSSSFGLFYPQGGSFGPRTGQNPVKKSLCCPIGTWTHSL